MHLKINDRTLEVRLGLFEKILAVYGSLEINLTDIVHVGTVPPGQTWKEIRAPGTYLPGLVKAGTYYGRGKEFWCVMRGKHPSVY